MNTKCFTFTFHSVAWLSKTLTVPFSTKQTLKYVRRTFIHKFLPLNTSHVHWLLHLTIQKHQRYFLSCFSPLVTLFAAYFQVFKCCITSAIPCFLVYMVRKGHCYLSLSFLTSKNMSGTLFVVSLLINTLFRVYCGILICKYVTRLYVAANLTSK